jgi:Dynamitin
VVKTTADKPSEITTITKQQTDRSTMSSVTTDPAAGAAAVESHAADEASGPGEVVFSSDGLNPPAPVQLRPPPIRQTTQTAGSGNCAVDYADNVSVEQAFEAFAGKLYYPSEKSVVGLVGASSSSSSATTKRCTGGETPLERLQRLHAEVKELESDLGSSLQQGDDDNDDPSLAMLASIQQIKTRLEAQQQNNAMISLLQQQEALARHVANSTRALNEPLPSAPASLSASSSPAGENAAILARLQKLEAVLGAASAATATATNNTNDASSSSLLQRLATLEKNMSRLDEKELEALTKKAKVIRQDLEAASKARSKLMSVVSTTGGASSAGGLSSATNASSGTSSSINIRAEDSKTITDLHDELVQLQGMTTHLPLLAQRLQSLAHLHASSATYASRLNAIEDLAVHKLPPQVSQLEQALNKMELNLQTSAQQMMENVQALQQRVDQLSS